MRTMSPDTVACALRRGAKVCAAAGAAPSARTMSVVAIFMIVLLAQRSICEVDCSIWSVAVMTLAFIS